MNASLTNWITLLPTPTPTPTPAPRPSASVTTDRKAPERPAPTRDADKGAENQRGNSRPASGQQDRIRPDVPVKAPVDNVDANGRVFVSDSPPDVFIVFDEANDKVEFWGRGGFGNLSQPMGITSDSSGNIYVADAGDARVVIFDTNGQYKNAIGGKE